METDGHFPSFSDIGNAIKEDWQSFQGVFGEGPKAGEGTPQWWDNGLQAFADVQDASATNIGADKGEQKAAGDRAAASGLGKILGLDQAKKCDEGSVSGCAWTAAAFLPFGAGKAGRAALGLKGLGQRALAGTANALARHLPVGTIIDKAVFYSGRGARDEALAFAAGTGRTMIDHTAGGRVLDMMKLYKWLPSSMADAPWKTLLQRFAGEASGDVSAFVSRALPDRVFAQTELSALNANPLVTSINNASKDLFTSWFWGSR
jgi:hypothetical protein